MARMLKTDEERAAERALEIDAMVSRLGRGRELWRDVRWPGGTLMMRLRVLTTGETQEAAAAAHARFRELELDINGLTLDVFSAEQVTQLLARACGDPARPLQGRRERWEPMFRTADILRETTTPDERAAVFVDYQELRDAVDPAPDAALDEDVLADIDEALKKRSPQLLASIGSWRLATYLLSTVYRPSSSPTDKSSSSSDSES